MTRGGQGRDFGAEKRDVMKHVMILQMTSNEKVTQFCNRRFYVDMYQTIINVDHQNCGFF